MEDISMDDVVKFPDSDTLAVMISSTEGVEAFEPRAVGMAGLSQEETR